MWYFVKALKTVYFFHCMEICLYKASKVIEKAIFTLSLIVFTCIYLKKKKMVNMIFKHIYIPVNFCNGSL